MPSIASFVLPLVSRAGTNMCRATFALTHTKIVQKGHDRDLFRKHATLRSAALPPEVQYPTVVVRLKIDPSMANRVGNLHGGCTATIFDDITTVPLTLVAREGAWQMAGVTRSLSVTYLKGVPVGEEVDVVAEVLNAGGRLGSSSLLSLAV